MPHTKNIQAFITLSGPNALVMAYGILVGLELALKDAGFKAGTGGHDVPAMLGRAKQTLATAGELVLAAQITGLEAKLKNDLNQLTCTSQSGNVQLVPAHSYPYSRYTRFQGDWGGNGETANATVTELLQTCKQILNFLQANPVICGVFL